MGRTEKSCANTGERLSMRVINFDCPVQLIAPVQATSIEAIVALDATKERRLRAVQLIALGGFSLRAKCRKRVYRKISVGTCNW